MSLDFVFPGLNELTDISKGKQLKWFHLGLFWHHIKSILLLYWVDIGLQSLKDSSCKRYLGVISSPSCFLNIASFMDDWAVLRKWNQTSPKNAKNPSASAPSGPLSVLFIWLLSDLRRVDLSLLSFSLWGNAIHCRPSVCSWIYWHFCVCII